MQFDPNQDAAHYNLFIDMYEFQWATHALSLQFDFVLLVSIAFECTTENVHKRHHEGKMFKLN